LAGLTTPGPHLEACSDRACDAQATCGADPVIEKRYTYNLSAHLDRGVFTSSGVEIQGGGGATQMGLSINAGNAGGSFDVAAGYSEGLIPGVQFSQADEQGSTSPASRRTSPARPARSHSAAGPACTPHPTRLPCIGG
jgi:hypothetical protein